jgi:hypothetical protein
MRFDSFTGGIVLLFESFLLSVMTKVENLAADVLNNLNIVQAILVLCKVVFCSFVQISTTAVTKSRGCGPLWASGGARDGMMICLQIC